MKTKEKITLVVLAVTVALWVLAAAKIGKLLMYFIAPVPVILIIIDVIVYLVKKTDNRFK